MLGAFDASTTYRDWPVAGRLTEPDWGDDRQPLPLEAAIERWPRGWVIRLPVGAEELVVEKQWVVAEQVVVRTRPVEDVVQVDETVRREELKVEADGAVDVTRPLPTGQFGGVTEGSQEATPDQRRRPFRRRATAEDIASTPAREGTEGTGSIWARPRPPAFRRPGESDHSR